MVCSLSRRRHCLCDAHRHQSLHQHHHATPEIPLTALRSCKHGGAQQRFVNLVLSLEPVTEIRLGCELDGHELPTNAIEREAFVHQDDATGKMSAFVRWSEGAWPPNEDDADVLATAFGEVLGPGYFESFLALIRSPSGTKREGLLKRAGAPTDIEERRPCCLKMLRVRTISRRNPFSDRAKSPRRLCRQRMENNLHAYHTLRRKTLPGSPT